VTKPHGAADGDSAPDSSPSTCRRCELWEHATQAVLGEGPRSARLMIVGEQPGNDEDLAGRPFVGPAGKLLRELLREAGIDPAAVFLTNAVKHFVWELRGKRRLHKTPQQRHIAACNVWLREEIARVAPTIIVTLGATALHATVTERLRVNEARESSLKSLEGITVIATYHPSAILRAPLPEQKADMRSALVGDLKRAAKLAGPHPR